MAANTTHPSFPQPADPSVKIWRYMDFTKFLAMLEQSSLYFARADLLGDPFEGSIPMKNVVIRQATFHLHKVPEASEQMANLARAMCKGIYVNCWHANELESAAMWKLYATSNQAIAVQTKYETLIRSFPDNEHLQVGQVEYIDYDTDTIDDQNLLSPFMHKRRSFEHEHEIRAVLTDFGEYVVSRKPSVDGRQVPVDVSVLVEQVRLAPSAPAWFRDLVGKVCERYGYTWPVNQSSLDAEPLY